MNFYKRHIGDYIKDAGHLTLLEHGVYTRLLDVYYTREAGIPQDKAARLVGARSKDEVQALANVLEEFFTLTDGTWTQGRCEEEIGNANAQADANRNNGKKGGRPKRNTTEQKPNGLFPGLDSESENNLSQTPDSRLQKNPDDNDDSTDSSSLSSSDDGIDLPPGAGAPLPPREDPPPSNDPAIALSVALRKMQVECTFTTIAVQNWVRDGVTLVVLSQAVAIAREQKPTGKIHPNYLVPIVEKILNPEAAKPGSAVAASAPAKPRAPTGTEPKGPDESYDAWQARVDKAEAARRKAQS